jgi:hypothetical protein
VACTPSGLQSGAAAADGAPTTPIAMPPQHTAGTDAGRSPVRGKTADFMIVIALRIFESIPDPALE